MSNYIERNLNNKETIVISAKKNWLYLLPSILLMVVFLVVAIVVQVKVSDLLGQIDDIEGIKLYPSIVIWVLFLLIGVLPFVSRLLKFLSINLALTNKRLIGKVGVLKLKTVDVPIDKLDRVGVEAGFWGNLLHYYSLTVLSVGGGGADFAPSKKGKGNGFVGISNAQEFKNAVTAAIEQHADEARKKQAEEIAKAMGR